MLAVAPAQAAEQDTRDMPGEHVHADEVDFLTLCTHEDWIVLNGISDEDGRIVSVCVNEGDDSHPGHLTLRYGTPEKVDFTYPAEAEGSFDRFVLRRYTRPQTTYLKFETTHGGLNYEVLAGGEETVFGAGFRIVDTDTGTVLRDHDLTLDTMPYGLMALEGLVPGAPFDE